MESPTMIKKDIKNKIEGYKFVPEFPQNTENQEILPILNGTKQAILNILYAEYKAYDFTYGSTDFFTDKQKRNEDNVVYKRINTYLEKTNNNETNVKLIGLGNFNYVYKINDKFVLRLSRFKKVTTDEYNALKIQYEKQIDCEHVPQLYSAGQISVKYKESEEYNKITTKWRVYSIMESLSGDELYVYMKENNKGFDKPKVNDIKQIIYNILKALECMYKKGVCHNDIKPENIMLTTKNDFSTVKLVDLGFISNCPDNKNKELPGTPGYIHYKYITEKGKSPKVDMWALGITCLELLHGDTFEQNDTNDEYTNDEYTNDEYTNYEYINKIYNEEIKTKFPEFEELLGLLLGIETMSSKIEHVPFSKNVTHCLQRMIDSTCKLYDNPYTILLNLHIFDETRLAEKEDKKVKFKKTVLEECASYINKKYKEYNLNFKPEELIGLIDYPNEKLNDNQMKIKLDVINCLNKHNLLSQGNGKKMSKRNRNKHTKRKSTKRKSTKRKSTKRK